MTTNAAIILNQHIDCNEGIYDFQCYNADAIFFFVTPYIQKIQTETSRFLT